MLGIVQFSSLIVLFCIDGSQSLQLPSFSASCTDPKGLAGECVNIHRCPALLRVLQAPSRTTEDLRYLMHFHCGFEGRQSKVCCAQVNPESFRETSSSTSCTNPRGLAGECVNIHRCPALVRVLQAPHRTAEETKYLKASHCGFEGTHPKVCCPKPSPNDSNEDENPNELLPENCGLDSSSKYGDAGLGKLMEHPWTVLLEYETPNGLQIKCGGALISKRYILTAGHCVKEGYMPDGWRVNAVLLGEYNKITNPDCVTDSQCADPLLRLDVEEIITHEKYLPILVNDWDSVPYSPNDIALIRLSRNVRFTDYIKPICLPKSNSVPKEFVIAGWSTSGRGIPSDIKVKGPVIFGDRRECEFLRAIRALSLAESHICINAAEGQNLCLGDSGSSLMALQPDGRGVERWTTFGPHAIDGTSCSGSGIFTVYTNVSSFTDWIIQNMRP